MDSSRFVLNSEWTSAFLTIEPRSREKIDSCEARAEELEHWSGVSTRVFFYISYVHIRTSASFVSILKQTRCLDRGGRGKREQLDAS